MGKISEPYYVIPKWIVQKYGSKSPQVSIWIELVSNMNTEFITSFTRDELCAVFSVSPKTVGHFLSEVESNSRVRRGNRLRNRSTLDFSGLYGISGTAQGTAGEPPRAHPRARLVTPFGSSISSNVELDTRAGARDGPGLPEWLNPDLWAEWTQFRKEKRQPLKPTTIRRQLAQLSKWRERGHNIEAIIIQSITNGWTGLFEVKDASSAQPTTGSSQSVREGFARLAREAERAESQTGGDEGPGLPEPDIQF